MAFTLSLPLRGTVQLRPDGPLCARRLTALRRTRRRSATRCSYATDLQTRTSAVEASSTDALLEKVEENLGKVIVESTMQEMVVHLADVRGMSRLRLVNAFGVIGATAVPALLEGLSTCPNAVVRRSCGKALAQIGDARATEPLINALQQDPDTVARASAAGALAKIGAAAVPALIDVLADGKASMAAKGHAAWALAYMQGATGDATAAALLDAARHPADDVRLAVVSALGAVLLGDALPIMHDAAERSEWDDATPAADDKVRAAAEATLLEAFKDSSAAVRAEAVIALASGGGRRHVNEVCALLKDPHPETRRAAALGLMKIRDVGVLEALRERVEDDGEEEQVRSVARLALKAIQRVVEESEWNDD